MNKKSLRHFFKKLRDDYRFIRRDLINSYDLFVCQNLISYIKCKDYKNIALYWPIASEANISQAIFELSKNYSILLPFVSQVNHPLQFNLYSPTSFREDALGQLLPVSEETILPDLVVAPLICVDLKGTRIGYGAGYYDRTFSQGKGPKTIGVGFSFQVCNTFVGESTDLILDSFISEKGIVEFKGR